MFAKYSVWLNSASVPCTDASPAGFQNVASAPETSLATEGPSAEPRGPTGISSSEAPLVPLRSSEFAPAVEAASTSRAARASARIARRFIVRTPFLPSGTCTVPRRSEVVQAFLLHEDHHPSHRIGPARDLHVVDVHAAAHRQ